MGVFSRLGELIRTELRRPAPPGLGPWHLLGSLAMFLLLIEIVSGILLMVYYRPSADEAYESVRAISSEAQLGWLIRGVHKWGADLLILVLLGHLLRVYFQGAYRERELNWVIGVLLFLLTGAFAFTGPLLVWDQSAFWSTDAVRKVLERVPILGGLVLDLLWGGRELESGTLLRFYVFHTGLLPWLTIALLSVHLYFVGRQGLFPISAGAQAANALKGYADLLLDGLLVALLAFGVLLTLAVLFTPALGERVDPLQLALAKTTWYFLPVYALFRLVSVGWSLFILGVGTLSLFLVPLLDRSSPGSRRWAAKVLGLLVSAMLILLGVLGYLRGGLL